MYAAMTVGIQLPPSSSTEHLARLAASGTLLHRDVYSPRTDRPTCRPQTPRPRSRQKQAQGQRHSQTEARCQMRTASSAHAATAQTSSRRAKARPAGDFVQGWRVTGGRHFSKDPRVLGRGPSSTPKKSRSTSESSASVDHSEEAGPPAVFASIARLRSLAALMSRLTIPYKAL